MNYHDLKKKATPGPLEARHGTLDQNNRRISEIFPLSNESGHMNDVVADVYSQEDADLIAHCVNKFEKVLEALKGVIANENIGGLAFSFAPDGLDSLITELEEVDVV